MSRMFGAAALLLVIMLLPGCMSTRAPRSMVFLNFPHAAEKNLTQSPHEHTQMAGDVLERDARALIEDLDILFLMDRPSRLNRWHNR